MSQFSLDFDVIHEQSLQWPTDESIKKVLVIGHGALAVRQKPTYEHWLKNEVEIHCADVDSASLDDCLDGIHRYVLPKEEKRMLAAAPFDLLCINNIPEHHLVSALNYGTYARRIVIQKPQDLNFPLIQTIAHAQGFDDFRAKTVIHDHYRNKAPVATLTRQLPTLLQQYGKFTRLFFFLTESKSVSDEPDRARSLKCGMIQDLAVHQIDIMLECLLRAKEWRSREGDERLNRRVGGRIEIRNCVKLVDQTSILGDDIETCALIDLHVEELIEFPAGLSKAVRFPHSFDVLIAVGKGLAVEQGVEKDLKSIVIDFERPQSYAVVDLASLSAKGLQKEEISRNHGGLNLPLMLISPNPPKHAVKAQGGIDYPLWQSISLAQHVAGIAQASQEWSQDRRIAAYPYKRPIGDLIRELASNDQIRKSVWSGLPPLTNFQVDEPLPPDYVP